MDIDKRKGPSSKTAGCGCDSCPTCPSQLLNSCRLQRRAGRPILRALTPVDPNGSNTTVHVSDAQPVNNVLAHQWAHSLCQVNSNLAMSPTIFGAPLGTRSPGCRWSSRPKSKCNYNRNCTVSAAPKVGCNLSHQTISGHFVPHDRDTCL